MAWGRRSVAAALAGALGMITLLALGARTEAGGPVTRVPDFIENSDLGHQTPPQPSGDPTGELSQPPLPVGEPNATAAMIGNLIQTLLIIAAAIAVLVIIVLVVRKVMAREAPPGLDELSEDVVDLVEVGRHLAASRREVEVSGDVRAAIVACWEGLEGVIGETGRSRMPHETASEFVTRVLAESDLSPQWTVQLSELYERAMFSAEQLTEDDRHRAVQSLTALTDEIDAGHGATLRTPVQPDAAGEA